MPTWKSQPDILKLLLTVANICSRLIESSVGTILSVLLFAARYTRKLCRVEPYAQISYQQ